MFKCEYCSKEFPTNSRFIRHQKTTKKCLLIQAQAKTDNLTCVHCSKKLSSKQRLNSHLITCKVKNKTLDQKYEELINEIKQIKEIPHTTITNNNITNTNNIQNNNYGSILSCLTPDIIQEPFKDFTVKDFLSLTQKQLADITVKYYLSGTDRPMYYVADRSRNKFMYTDEENNIKEDPDAKCLRSIIYEGYKPLLRKIYTQQMIRAKESLALSMRKDDQALIDSDRDDLKKLNHVQQETNIEKEYKTYNSQLGKALPSCMEERLKIDKQKIEKEIELDSDEETQSYINYITRMIGDHTASELEKFKKIYKENGTITGPRSILLDPVWKGHYIEYLNDKR